MNYRANIQIARNHFVTFPVIFLSDARLDAVTLLLGYDGLREKRVSAKIEHLRDDKWETFEEFNVFRVIALADMVRSGKVIPDYLDRQEILIWARIQEWFTRSGSPWRVL
jgi:hypothetical protein